MAIIIDKVSFSEFTGHTPDFVGNPQYLVVTEENLAEYNLFKAQGIDKKFWKIVDDALVIMSAEEQAAFTTAELAAYKDQAKFNLSVQCNTFIQSKYTLENQQTISYLMDMAERQNKQLRFDYFNQVGTWASLILGYYYVITDRIFNLAPTIADVDAIMATVRFDQFLPSDPAVTIRAGLAIEP